MVERRMWYIIRKEEESIIEKIEDLLEDYKKLRERISRIVSVVDAVLRGYRVEANPYNVNLISTREPSYKVTVWLQRNEISIVIGYYALVSFRIPETLSGYRPEDIVNIVIRYLERYLSKLTNLSKEIDSAIRELEDYVRKIKYELPDKIQQLRRKLSSIEEDIKRP